jgi:hypothetical protein
MNTATSNKDFIVIKKSNYKQNNKSHYKHNKKFQKKKFVSFKKFKPVKRYTQKQKRYLSQFPFFKNVFQKPELKKLKRQHLDYLDLEVKHSFLYHIADWVKKKISSENLSDYFLIQNKWRKKIWRKYLFKFHKKRIFKTKIKYKKFLKTKNLKKKKKIKVADKKAFRKNKKWRKRTYQDRITYRQFLTWPQHIVRRWIIFYEKKKKRKIQRYSQIFKKPKKKPWWEKKPWWWKKPWWLQKLLTERALLVPLTLRQLKRGRWTVLQKLKIPKKIKEKWKRIRHSKVVYFKKINKKQKAPFRPFFGTPAVRRHYANLWKLRTQRIPIAEWKGPTTDHWVRAKVGKIIRKNFFWFLQPPQLQTIALNTTFRPIIDNTNETSIEIVDYSKDLDFNLMLKTNPFKIKEIDFNNFFYATTPTKPSSNTIYKPKENCLSDNFFLFTLDLYNLYINNLKEQHVLSLEKWLSRKSHNRSDKYYKKIIIKYLHLLSNFYKEIAISKLQKTTPADNAVKLINQFSRTTGFSIPGFLKKRKRFPRRKKFWFVVRFQKEITYVRTKKSLFKMKVIMARLLRWLYNTPNSKYLLGVKLRRAMFPNYNPTKYIIYKNNLKLHFKNYQQKVSY